VVLQLVSTLAAIAVPIVVAVVGYRLNQRLKDWEATHWRNQELIKARLQYFDRLAPMLNDLLCYFTYIGRWRELTPPEVVALKRDTDRLFLSVAPLFSQDAVDEYRAFMRQCFERPSGWGSDVLLRTGFSRRREILGDAWRGEWEAMFASASDGNVGLEIADLRAGYDRLVGALVEDVGIQTRRGRYTSTWSVPDVR